MKKLSLVLLVIVLAGCSAIVEPSPTAVPTGAAHIDPTLIKSDLEQILGNAELLPDCTLKFSDPILIHGGTPTTVDVTMRLQKEDRFPCLIIQTRMYQNYDDTYSRWGGLLTTLDPTTESPYVHNGIMRYSDCMEGYQPRYYCVAELHALRGDFLITIRVYDTDYKVRAAVAVREKYLSWYLSELSKQYHDQSIAWK